MPGDLVDFDPVDFLDTPEARAEYINAALEEGTEDELREALATVARAEGMEAVAKGADISRAGIYKALGASGDPRLSTLAGILDAVGLRLSVTAK